MCNLPRPVPLSYIAMPHLDLRSHPAYDPQWRDSNPEADAWAIARERLDWIDGARSVAELLRQEIPEDEIASRLGLNSSRVRRAGAYLQTLGGVVPESPEEIVARCVVTRGDREAMVERLKTWPYTFGSQAEPPFEGGTTGSVG